MQSNDDIYRKDDPPALARRRTSARPASGSRRRRSASSSRRSDSSRRSSRTDRDWNREGTWSSRGNQARQDPSRITRRPGSSRRRRKKQNSLLPRLVMIGLSVLLIGYLGFLGWFLTVGSRPDAAATTPAEPAEPAAPAPPPSEVDYSREISRWETVDRLIQTAQGMIAQGQSDLALDRLQSARERAPDNVRVLRELGRLQLERDEYAAAETLFREALAIDPFHSATRLNLGRALMGRTLYAEVISVAEWILEADAYSVPAHRLAADAYLSLDEPAKALAHLRRLANLDQDDIIAENRLASAYTMIGEYDKAVDLYRTIIRKDPEKSVTYFNLAACYARQGEAEAAVEVLDRALDTFGRAYITTWMKSEDFDSIRDADEFQAFSRTAGIADGS